MPLLVVPLGPDESDLLTLAEWDALTNCERVLFERPDHPLSARLRAAGVTVSAFDDEPDAGSHGWALVTDPSSDRVLELARAGAEVSGGPASLPDPLTAAHAAPYLRKAAAALADLTGIMARLRSDDGCPWDREQTHDSLKVHLLEEAHEVLDAIDRGLTGPELQEELGDLLLQVAFHARVAAQDGRFDLADVATGIAAKLVHRHPHVFGDTLVSGAGDVIRNWEQIKAAEKGRADPFDDLPAALPALLAAYKTQKRAAATGFAVDEIEARARLASVLEGPEGPEDLGEALFWLVAIARARGLDPESALREATLRFRTSQTAHHTL